MELQGRVDTRPQVIFYWSVEDPGFSRGRDANSEVVGTDLLFGQISPKTTLKNERN